MCVSLTFFMEILRHEPYSLRILKKSGSENKQGRTCIDFRATLFFLRAVGGSCLRMKGSCLPPYSGIRRAGVKFMRVWARKFFKKILYLTHPERVE